MTLSDLASIGSLVSGVAVLVSLVYLALQVRQAQRNQRAAIHQSRLEARSLFLDKLAGSPSAELLRRGYRADPSMTELEGDQYVAAMVGDLFLYEEWFYQYRDGMIDKARWESSLRTLTYEMSFPGFRAAWLSTRGFFQDDFGEIIDALRQKMPVTKNEYLTPQWREVASRERAGGSGAGEATP